MFKDSYLATKSNKFVISIVLIIIAAVIFISIEITDQSIKKEKENQYNAFSQKVQTELNLLIKYKQEVTSFIALSLARDTNLINALELKDNSLINLNNFSKKLNELTVYKNVWFQIIDKNGVSFYRSWTKKCGDSMIEARADVRKMIKEPKVMSTISTGKYDMTFKSMVPMYNENKEFIGIFEIITHFNSISKNFSKDGIKTIFLVDKKYKKQLTKAFTNIFIDDYYVAVLEPNIDIMAHLEKYGVEKYISKDTKYMIDKNINNLIINISIPDVNGEAMGYALVFKDLDSLILPKVDYIVQNRITIMIILIFFVVIVAYYLISNNYQKNLVKQHEKHNKELILNTKFSTMGKMSAGITHEINTPLTYIKGTTEMSTYDIEELPDSQIKQRLLEDNKSIISGVRRIEIIIDSMKEISQKVPSEKMSFNIYSTIITVLRILHNRTKQTTEVYINNELFDFEGSDKDKYHFMASVNVQKIEQVWIVILNNALDELVKIDNFEDRRVDIYIEKVEHMTKVQFQDNAGGIPANMLDKLFEPFVSNKESSGIGIGLNVAKSILDEHNALIKVENKNNGALFTITFDNSLT